MKRLKQKNWKGECGRIISRSRGLRKDRRLQPNKLQRSKSPSKTTEIRLGGSRAQDGILKYMLKLMEVCKARGFVYGIIPKKGKPMSGASDNIRAWWKEEV